MDISTLIMAKKFAGKIVENDVPKIYFTGTTPTSKAEGDLRLFMRYISKTARIEKPVTLKVQGSSSVNYPKKNFTMKVYADGTYDKKEKLQFRAWPAMNKFVLKAHWMDRSHVRNVGTAKIWGKIVASRSDYASLPEELRAAANNGATDGFTCKVFVNGVYQGLYELIVPKDALFGQDKDVATHSIMCSEWNNQDTCAFATTTPTISGNWSEELQDSMSPAIATSFADFIKFVAGSTDEEFVANAETYFDVQSVIDYNILARVFCIVDNLCRNQIFYSYDGKKWYEGAWDFDAVLGNPPTVRGFYAWDTAFQNGYVAYADHGVVNRLYERVETLFVDRFKARYAELREDILSADNIIEVYERMTDVIKAYDGLLEEDYAPTTGSGAFVSMPYKEENNIQQIRNFVAARLPYMDKQVASIGEVPDNDNGLLDGATLTNGAYIDFNDGNVVTGAMPISAVTDYIPVEAGVVYELSSTNVQVTEGNIRFYDAEEKYLVGTNVNDKAMPVTFIAPEGCAYLRLHILHADATEMPTIDDLKLSMVPYQLKDGTHNFTDASGSMTIQNNNSVAIAYSSNEVYANFMTGEIGSTPGTAYTYATKLFTLKAGDAVTLKLKNIVINDSDSKCMFTPVLLAEGRVEIKFGGNIPMSTLGSEYEYTSVITSDINIGSVNAWLGAHTTGSDSAISFDLFLYVNGDRYI